MTNDYSYEMTMQPSTTDELMFAMLAAFGVFMFAALVVSLLMYVFYGLGMSKIAENEGRAYAWLAWVPIVNLFMIPMSVESDVHGWLKGRFTKVNVWVYILALAVSFTLSFAVPFMPVELALLLYIPSFLLMLIPSFLLLYGFYFLTVRYSDNVIWHLLLAIATSGAAVPFQLFRWRNREPRVN